MLQNTINFANLFSWFRKSNLSDLLNEHYISHYIYLMMLISNKARLILLCIIFTQNSLPIFRIPNIMLRVSKCSKYLRIFFPFVFRLFDSQLIKHINWTPQFWETFFTCTYVQTFHYPLTVTVFGFKMFMPLGAINLPLPSHKHNQQVLTCCGRVYMNSTNCRFSPEHGKLHPKTSGHK